MIGRHCLDGQEACQIRSKLLHAGTDFNAEKLTFLPKYPLGTLKTP